MNNIIEDIDVKTCPVTSLLVAVGQVLLKGSNQSEWVDMESLVKMCRDNNISFEGKLPNGPELESQLRALFKKTDEVYADGVNVIWADRRIGWDLIFAVRFYRYNPDLPTFANKQLGGEEVA